MISLVLIGFAIAENGNESAVFEMWEKILSRITKSIKMSSFYIVVPMKIFGGILIDPWRTFVRTFIAVNLIGRYICSGTPI